MHGDHGGRCPHPLHGKSHALHNAAHGGQSHLNSPCPRIHDHELAMRPRRMRGSGKDRKEQLEADEEEYAARREEFLTRQCIAQLIQPYALRHDAQRHGNDSNG